MNKVAVYGSLLSGMGNHGLLKRNNAVFLGEDTLPPEYSMISLGGFPGVFPNGEHPLKIEVYEVDENCELSLDRLEGFNKDNPESSFYIKELITTRFGDTFIYFLNRKGSSRSFKNDYIEDGDWRNYLETKQKAYYED